MTDNEIIKAFDNLLSRKWIVAKSGAEFITMGDVADLINRQRAEIERLNKELEIRPPASASFVFKLEEMQEKEKMLEAKWKADVRAEAIKEFAERLKEEFKEPCACNFSYVRLLIGNLVKEMVGDGDG